MATPGPGPVISGSEIKVFGPSPEQLEAARSAVQGRMMKAIISPPSGVRMRDLKAMLNVSNKLRDQSLWELPLVNDAASTYQDLASTREWQVQGKINAVARTVELINEVATYDIETGYVTRGFEQYLRRRALDHIAVGRTAFATRHIDDKGKFQFEYLDPTRLVFQRKNIPSKTPVPPVKPEEIVWRYGLEAEPTLQSREVHINHPIPIGFNRFISPLLLVYPTALMAWLVREHDTASLDGRKIRDLFIVDERLRNAIEEGLTIQMALWSGADPTATGFPVIGTNTSNYQRPLADFIHRLGLSNIPDEFNRKEFMHSYANEIAAAFGLALRQFYNEESTTNRALEDVQEARQQQKGPPAFVRSEERMINASAVVKVHSPGKPVRFSFIEEADTQSLKDKATAFNLQGQALKAIGEVFGASVKPEIWLAQMQSMGLLPSDIPIEDMLTGVAVQPANTGETAQNSSGGGQTNKPGEVAQSNAVATRKPSDVAQTGTSGAKKSFDPEETLDYGDVIMNGKGLVVANRVRSFQVLKMLVKGLENEDNDLLASDERLSYTDGNTDSHSSEDDDGLADPLPIA
jgi:hypothetical protein